MLDLFVLRCAPLPLAQQAAGLLGFGFQKQT